jgi:hypothetical protein
MRTTTRLLNQLLLPLGLALLIVGPVPTVFADKVCVRAALKRGRVTLRSSTIGSNQACPRGTTQLVDTATLTGPQGPAGTNGANGTNGSNGSNGTDGSLRIFGDGSAGNVSVSTSSFLSDPNQQYQNLVIDSGVIWGVPSGTVIRSMGSVTINGFISVAATGSGGPARRPATQGHAKSPAGDPDVGSNADFVFGGIGGVGLLNSEARVLLRSNYLGGGSGSGPFGFDGGHGGGSLTILAKDGISISGSGVILADGQEEFFGGYGGGGGGIVVLASSGSITNSGTISVTGGDGAPSNATFAAGGGGGGGIVHMLAPSITSGTVVVTRGSVGNLCQCQITQDALAAVGVAVAEVGVETVIA